MYLLTLRQVGYQTKLGLFDSLEEGRDFVSKIPGYNLEQVAGFVQEYIDPKDLSDYEEIDHKGNIVPLSRFMFPDDEMVDVDWWPLPRLDQPGQGMVDGSSRVDAYMVDNKELQTYINRREEQYSKLKKLLQSKGIEVDRHFLTSEDGEAVVYKKEGDDRWRFLTHMDPFFVEEEDLAIYLEDID